MVEINKELEMKITKINDLYSATHQGLTAVAPTRKEAIITLLKMKGIK